MRPVALLLLLLAGCAAVEVPPAVPPVSAGLVRIQTFTEPSPAVAVHPLGAFVFVVTADGIERWDRDGNVLEISATHGLPSRELVAVTSDRARSLLWILMPGALGRYDAASDIYDELALPAEGAHSELLSLRAGDLVVMAPALAGGVWIATPTALLRASGEGWTTTPLDEPVHALADTPDGLLLASASGLRLRRSTGDQVALGAEQGLAITYVTHLVPAPRLGGTLILGRDDARATRLAIGREQKWHTYRVLPSVEVAHAALDDDGVVLASAGALYRLAPPAFHEVRPLARDGVRLSAVSGGAPALELAAMQLQLPPKLTSIAVSDEHVLIGTAQVGVARYGAGAVRPGSWLRRRRMLSAASTLSVACHAPTDCWLATGTRSAWRWTGERFVAGGPDEVVLAVVRDRDGAIVALHREARDAVIRLSRVDSSGQWVPVPQVALETPSKDPELTFARASTSGALWLGIGYRDGRALRPWGVAIIDVASGKVQISPAPDDERADIKSPPRAADGSSSTPASLVAVPRGVTDADLRGKVAWFASDSGVARLASGQLTTWDASEGLRSAAVRAIAVSRGNTVYAATSAGVGRLAGGRWQFPAPLGFEVNDLALTAAGQLWMATPRGIAAYDGVKVRRVDLRRGLVENQLLDIAIDRYDRVWARGPGSLTLISPVAPGAARAP